MDAPDHHLYICLTTIRARLGSVHRVVESLLGQKHVGMSFEILLTLSPDPYLLDEGCPNPTPELLQLQDRHAGVFRVDSVPNTGPYRKILPLLRRLHDLPSSEFGRSLLITVDDDTLYPPDWLASLYAAYRRHDCVIGFRGRSMTLQDGELDPYRGWATSVEDVPSLRTVLTGKDGILYSPQHLHPAVMDEAAALRIAPKADDLWLKAHTLLVGVPSFAIHDSLAQEFPSVEGVSQDVSLYRAYNRRGGNDHAIDGISRHLSERYGRSLADLAQPHAIDGLTAAITL